MNKKLNFSVICVICQLLLFSSLCFASLPVKYTSEACVSGGKVYTLQNGKRVHTLELPKEFNLSPYEGKKVMLEGELTPGDYFVPRDKTLKVIGSCTQGAAMPGATAPSKPTQQPPKSPTPQSPKPTASQPAAPRPEPSRKPTAQQPSKPTPQTPQSGAPKASQPAQQKPQGGSASPADCKRNCQRQYDEKISNCAGYKLGNTASACKDPLTRELQSCMQSCK